jgi:gliding motility-associated-like protein
LTRIQLFVVFVQFFYLGLYSQPGIIVPPDVIKVSYNISNNYVQIHWNPSTSSDVTSYEVWFASMNAVDGRIGFEKVPGTGRISSTEPLQMEFYHSDAQKNSMGYYIRAYNNLNKYSNNTFCDSTVFLKAVFDSCSSSITLEWNDYNAWRNSVANYKIFGKTDNNNYKLYGSVPEGQNTFTINNIEPNSQYHLYILTTNKNSGDSVFSFRADIETNMTANPDTIISNFGTVSGGHPLLRFTVDETSQLSRYVLVRSLSPSAQYDSLTLIQTDGDVIEYTDESVSSAQQAYYYKLNALNNCDAIVKSSPIAGTIYLNALADGATVNLSWNEYIDWYNGVANYILERKINAQNYEVLHSAQSLSYSDQSFENQGNNLVGSEICYKVTAYENKISDAASSVSNEVCVSLDMNVRFEFDAFVPGSAENNSFGPTMDFIPESIKLSIFNRWGNLVFESSDIYNLRWDGSFKNQPADQGVYRYQLEYKNENGKTVVQHGNVTVVYP